MVIIVVASKRPIVYLNFAGQNVVLLNTKEVANELLDRRSANYSDRPNNIVANYLGGLLVLPLTRYGKRWHTMRRASHSVLNTAPLTSIQRTAASNMVSMCYGKPPLSSDEPILQKLNDMAHRLTTSVYPGTHLVEIFPILDYFPSFMTKWKRDAKEDYKKFTTFFEQCFEEALEHKERASLSVKLAEEQIKTGLTDLEKVWVSGTLYLAGYETTTIVLAWLLYVVTIYPDVQRKAQEEIDQVVGRARAPTFGDMEHLPYVQAIVKEVFRWQSPVPFGLPHASMEDDWYEDKYFIPKGTICIANIWSINRSTNIYGADAVEFRPERFLNEDGTLRSDEDEHSAYGFGRRICVGRHVADNSLFINIATVLWALNIVPSTDKEVPQEQKRDSLRDIMNRPPELQRNFIPRFPEVEGILDDMISDMVVQPY
ncbi:cytochrome P450 [Rhodocollybia butyracea]|uniref:Cytochrome P450 n=1 Tax=Rhodocollybia butyracea TaxID=206335 RepID=A0A9P5Q4W7_9AGAR|nr:cytochrome P450 [Rhodocollybia butyracea]